MNTPALVAVVSAALAANDPLDPWLVQSNYDEAYWDVEAALAANTVARATCQEDVYDALVKVLSHLVRPPEGDDYVRKRLEASSAAIWRWLQSPHPELPICDR